MGKKSLKKKQVKAKQKTQRKNREVLLLPKINSNYIIIFIIFLGFAVYSNTFNSPFHLDDNHAIVKNTAIKDITDIKTIWNIQPTRFLTFFTFALNYHFHGLAVVGYHIVNIIIHIAASIFLYFLVLLTLQSPVLRNEAVSNHSNLIAAFTALLFLVHPVQTQAVTYIVQRLASMAALFYIGSLTLYAKARLTTANPSKRILWYVLFVIITIASFFTKETSFTLPLMLILYEVAFFQKKPVLNWQKVSTSIMFIAVIAALLLYMKPDFGGLSLHETRGGIIELTRVQYMITQLSVITTYFRLMLIPVNQNLDYDYPVFNSLFNADIILSIIVLGTITVLAILLYKKQRIISFGIIWVFVTLLPESSIIPISDVIFEHRMYLPMAGFSMAFVAGIYCLMKNVSLRVMIAGFVVILLMFALLTYNRNNIWSSALTLWDDTVKKSPGKARPYFYRGNALMEAGKIEKAIKDYSAAIEINPNHQFAFNNRGKAYFELGNYEKAYNDLTTDIKINPGEWIGYFNKGKVYDAIGQYNNAVEEFKKSASIKPRAETYYYIGFSYAKMGKDIDAIEYFTKAIEMEPLNEVAYYNRGISYANQGKNQNAIKDFSKAIEINRQYESAYYNRGLLHHTDGSIDEAIEDYSVALRIHPQHLPALNNRGLLYLSIGEEYKALSDFKKAIEISPDCGECYYNLAIYYDHMNDSYNAAAALKKAEELGYSVQK